MLRIDLKIIRRRFVLLLWTGIFLIVPFSGSAQREKFTIRGLINFEIEGLKIKPERLVLKGSAVHKVAVTYTDTLGGFKFSGLTAGKYRLTGRRFKIDTLIEVNKQTAQYPLIVDLKCCRFGAELAKNDIRKDSIKLMLAGGIAPVYIRGQEKCERKYHFQYCDFGDTGPSKTCLLQYNRVIFKYFDKKYGTAWRKEVRQDVVGIGEGDKTR